MNNEDDRIEILQKRVDKLQEDLVFLKQLLEHLSHEFAMLKERD